MSNSKLGRQIRRMLLDGTVGAFVSLYVAYLFIKPEKDFLLQTTKLAIIAVSAIIICSLLFALISRMFQVRTVGRIVFSEPTDRGHKVLPWFKTFWGAQFFIFFICLFSAGITSTKFSFLELFSEEGFAGAQRIFRLFFTPIGTS